jgi:hypothetical protein
METLIAQVAYLIQEAVSRCTDGPLRSRAEGRIEVAQKQPNHFAQAMKSMSTAERLISTCTT